MNKKLATAIGISALVVLAAAPAFAQSSKAAWRFKEAIALSQSADTDPATPAGLGPTETPWVNILRTHIKTPNAKELAIGVSLQCGILTDTTVRSKSGALDTSTAQARIRVRVKITQPDGSIVFAEPDNGMLLNGGVLPVPPPSRVDPIGLSFCERIQRLEARFAGLNCTAGDDGVVTCTDPETLRLLLSTLEANHFNFLHANAVPGVQLVEVQAKAAAGVALGGTSLGAAGAEAFVGSGALYVETIRLIHNADGTTDLDNLR
jgi:hypothetical protein